MELHEVFQKIMGVAVLSDEDRAQIKRKRGFTDEQIDCLKLKTINEDLLRKCEELEIPEEVRACLYGAYQEREAGKHILIPYLAPDGDPYHLRPHKFGISGAGAHVYVPYELLKDTSRLVLAESEFKAAASCVMGVSAIGIPGINTFSKDKLPELIKIIEGLNCKEIIVCFDNEDKSDPTNPNFKPDFTKRYDTIIYEFIMAQLLRKQGLKARIARLPNDWRVGGKIDIDGVLAKGTDHKIYQRIISIAMDPWEYRRSWKLPASHRAFVERRIDSLLYVGPIKEEFNSYFHAVSEDKKRKLTNFTVSIAYTLFGASGAERYCRLKSSYGQSASVIVKPEIMVSKQAFQKFCYELGDYEFMGDEKGSDLQKIWNYVILHQEGKMVRKLEFFGFDEDTKIWFFSNGAYCKNKFYPSDDDGIVWVEDEGFMLPQKIDEEKEIMEPVLCSEDNGVNLGKVYEKFSKVIDPHYAKMILGWALGNFFMPEIMKEWKVFPFLFFYGKQQSGKSTLSNWVSSFFGFTQKGVPFASSTLPALSRAASRLSMVPLWFEEYRQRDPNLANKNNFLRNVYDKSTRIIAKKGTSDVIGYKPRAALILSGEEAPQDAALNSRCVMIPVFRGEQDPDSFGWMQDNSPQFNSIGHKILSNKEEYWKKVKEYVGAYIKAFEKDLGHTDNRSRLHNSILAGVCDVFLGTSSDFVEFIGAHTEERSRHVDTSQALYVFYEDILNMWGTRRIEFPFIKLLQTEKGKRREVAFWFRGAYSAWETHYRGNRNDIPASKAALAEHMKREPYFIANAYAKIGGKSMWAVIMNYDHADFPESLRNIVVAQAEDSAMNQQTEERYESIKDVESKGSSKLVFGEKRS